jgi:DNA repair protein RadC
MTLFENTYKSKVNKISLFREPTKLTPVKIFSSETTNNFARQFYDSQITIIEDFYLILLNNSNLVTGYVHISKGGITGTLVDVRIIAKHALESLATAVILVHNHPSGTLRPSQADKDVTKKIQNALELFDVKVLDHLILTEHAYFSFADENIL